MLKALSGSDVYIADQLFATLDPLSRRIDLPSGRHVVLTDTVGFIQKLPTTLIAAFRATLEEVTEADLLLHVVDTAHPNVLQHIESVEDTLAEIEVPDIPRILVWNKIDQYDQTYLPERIPGDDYADEVSVSAQTGKGLNELLQKMETVLTARLHRVRLLLPYQRGELVSELYDAGSVETQEHTDDGVVLTVQIPFSLYEKYKAYQITG